ncbi:hypothetical protein LSAT2_017569 [Lamellibrachia satsuma]|nr:hypothetical protein LSAT2_017569 [Lamellibrachia satsuma]
MRNTWPNKDGIDSVGHLRYQPSLSSMLSASTAGPPRPRLVGRPITHVVGCRREHAIVDSGVVCISRHHSSAVLAAQALFASTRVQEGSRVSEQTGSSVSEQTGSSASEQTGSRVSEQTDKQVR